MPAVNLLFYREGAEIPALDWLDRQEDEPKARCIAALNRLEREGHELRRPHADLLRDGIWGLRIRVGHVHYRLLYFFAGRSAVVVSHGLTKERAVPAREIDQAVERSRRFERDPASHYIAR